MAHNRKQEIGGFAGWVIRQVQQGRERKAAGAPRKRLANVETLSLGGRRQIALVAFDGQHFLVGMNGDSITAIAPAGSSVSASERASFAAAAYEAALPAETRDVYVFEQEPPRAAHRLVRFGGGL